MRNRSSAPNAGRQRETKICCLKGRGVEWKGSLGVGFKAGVASVHLLSSGAVYRYSALACAMTCASARVLLPARVRARAGGLYAARPPWLVEASALAGMETLVELVTIDGQLRWRRNFQTLSHRRWPCRLSQVRGPPLCLGAFGGLAASRQPSAVVVRRLMVH